MRKALRARCRRTLVLFTVSPRWVRKHRSPATPREAAPFPGDTLGRRGRITPRAQGVSNANPIVCPQARPCGKDGLGDALFNDNDVAAAIRRVGRDTHDADGPFPDFAKNPLNRIASALQYADEIEGYVFDSIDGSMEVTAGTRTMHVFGGRRANRNTEGRTTTASA